MDQVPEQTLQHRRESAAQLLAEGRYGYSEIAAKVGVSVRALHKWRKNPIFARRVAEFAREFLEAAMRRGIARLDFRIKTLADAHSKLLELIEERAADPKMQDIPGGKTGLIVMQFRAVGTGDRQKIVPEFVFDASLIREVRAIQAAAAKELGQITEKFEFKRSFKDMTDAELLQLIGDADPGEGPGTGSSRIH